LTEFSDLHLDSVSPLYNSQQKGTQVLHASHKGRAVIVKHVLPGNERSLGFLRKEAHYYALLRESAVVPHLISAGNDYLMTEYVGSQTVWQRGSKNSEDGLFFSIASQVGLMLRDFNTESHKNEQSTFRYWIWFVRAAHGQLKRLLLSGPKGTTTSRGNHFCCQLFYFLALPVSLPLLIGLGFLFSAFYSHRMGGRYHGDLHGNNVLLSDGGKVFVVDFENVLERPGKVLDLSYFVATSIWGYRRRELSKVLRAHFLSEGRFFYFLVSILIRYMVLCAGLNGRFRRRSRV
jgi:hypothetical protein